MTKTEIRREIESVLIQMGIPFKSITQKSSYSKDLGLDSLDFTELFMELELRFDLDMNCTDIENIETIKDTVDYVSRLFPIGLQSNV